MSKLITLLALILTVSCAKIKHELEGEAKAKIDAPESISFEPDFEKAAQFCDNRYGVGTEAAEDCFQDFRNYYDLEVKVDLDAISNFCDKYDTQEEVNSCTSELLALFNSMGAAPGMIMAKPE
jgi:hypothetical protein